MSEARNVRANVQRLMLGLEQEYHALTQQLERIQAPGEQSHEVYTQVRATIRSLRDQLHRLAQDVTLQQALEAEHPLVPIIIGDLLSRYEGEPTCKDIPPAQAGRKRGKK